MVLRVGQKVPNFSLFDSEKKERSLSEFTQNGTVVLVFFPFAFSGACDRMMCAFRDGLVGEDALKGNVVGVSIDSVFTLKIFSETYNLGFPLLSDFNKKVTRSFDVLEDRWEQFSYRGVAKQSVFVIDRKGALRYRWVSEGPNQEPPYDRVAIVVNKLD